MHPLLIKAREIRIANDTREQTRADERKRLDASRLAHCRLVTDAIADAFAGVRVCKGDRIRIVAQRDGVSLYGSADSSLALVRVVIEEASAQVVRRYRINGLGSMVYTTIPELLNGIASVIANHLDLDTPSDRSVLLTADERTLVRQALDALIVGYRDGSWTARPPGGMIEADVAALRDRFGD